MLLFTISTVRESKNSIATSFAKVFRLPPARSSGHLTSELGDEKDSFPEINVK